MVPFSLDTRQRSPSKDIAIAESNWQTEPVKSFARPQSRSTSPNKSWSNASPPNSMIGAGGFAPPKTSDNEISALFENFVSAEDLRTTLSIFAKIKSRKYYL